MTENMRKETEGTRKSTKSIFVVCKLRVENKPELEDDFEMFKLHWKRI